jgi:hypothetical protein
MAEKPFRRLYLADLVMAALFCGLAVALFTQRWPPADAAIIIFLISVVVASWTFFHQRRGALTCEECGRRFILPRRLSMPGPCLHCGREQLALTRSIRRIQKVFWGVVGVVVLLLAAMAMLVMRQTGGRATAADIAGVLNVVGCLGLMMLALIGLGVYRSFLMRPKERACEVCGLIIELDLPAGSKSCPQCQSRHLHPDAAKKQQIKALGVFLALLVMLSLFGAILFGISGGSSPGMMPWLRMLLLFLAVFVAIVIGMAMLLFLARMLLVRRLRSERGTLAMVWKCAGEEGELVKDGAWSIWYSGTDDPLPLLREQTETARMRFENLLGGAPVAEPPLRLFVFHNRGAFLRFHIRIFPGADFTSYGGVYQGHPYQILTLCTAPAPCRIDDAQHTTRSLVAYALLESVWGPGPPTWLQSGLSKAVANCDDQEGLSHLNRRLVASLSRGTALSVEIFTLSLNDLSRLMRGSKDPGCFQRLHQFHDQAWSIVEYLCGEQGPHHLRTSLGAFLRDARSKTDQGESFRLHFGQGWEPLFDGWRQWVLDQGIGTYKPPPDRIRDGLLERVLPVIRDRQAKRGDRIAAIHEWADVGFVLGADTLIHLLRQPGNIPEEEIVWALCMVSGLTLGDDPNLWQAWWDDLPSAGDERSGG